MVNIVHGFQRNIYLEYEEIKEKVRHVCVLGAYL